MTWLQLDWCGNTYRKQRNVGDEIGPENKVPSRAVGHHTSVCRHRRDKACGVLHRALKQDRCWILCAHLCAVGITVLVWPSVRNEQMLPISQNANVVIDRCPSRPLLRRAHGELGAGRVTRFWHIVRRCDFLDIYGMGEAGGRSQ